MSWNAFDFIELILDLLQWIFSLGSGRKKDK